LPGGHSLFLLDGPLAGDAVSGKGKCFQALVRDRFATPLAGTERPLFDLLQGSGDFLQDAAVTVSELEEKLPGVRSRRLVTKILDGIVLLPFAIEGAFPHFFKKLPLLFEEFFSVVSQSVLFHNISHRGIRTCEI
ncbi:MAG TPA: hypothetical protein VJO34_17740, partial [Methylomirabilota bacterium]|nr:hypothetical protein [Methylomirabilota bacterium]